MPGPPPSPYPPPSTSSGWAARPAGGSPPALPPLRVLLVFGGAFLALVVAALVLVFVLAPREPPPDCPDSTQSCPGPPIVAPPLGTIGPPGTTEPTASTAPLPSVTASPLPSPGETPSLDPTMSPSPISDDEVIPIIIPPQIPSEDSPRLVNQTVTASEAGFAVEHPEYWTVQQTDADTLVMGVSFDSVAARVNVRFDGAPASSTSPAALIDQLLPTYTQISALSEDFDDAHRVLRPSIGFEQAVLRQFRGTLTTAGGVEPISLTIVAATNGQLTMATSVLATNPDSTFTDGMRVQRAVGFLVDPLLKHFRWTAEP